MRYDMVVVGGGIHGAGVAQAAAAAGHSVLVLEQYPTLAQGTSSRSSKLVHGGLRYLETLQFGLVRQSLRERKLLLELAPDLVRLVPFHIPLYNFTRRKSWQIRAGLSLYALLGGLHADNRFSRLPSSEWDDLDGLSREDLVAVYRYYDAQTDDGALTRAVMASAGELGAELQMSSTFKWATLDNDGVTIGFTSGSGENEVRARALVNASGPWVNNVLELVNPLQKTLPVDLVQGAHLVLPGKLSSGIYYVETADGRVIFAIPWRDNILVGTTETPWTSDPAATFPLDDEIEYLLGGFARFFPEMRCERSAIVASFAGLRVLPGGKGGAFGRSRDVILHGPTTGGPRRLISIYGGKLTTYRATAEKTLMQMGSVLPARERRADTRRLRLVSPD